MENNEHTYIINSELDFNLNELKYFKGVFVKEASLDKIAKQLTIDFENQDNAIFRFIIDITNYLDELKSLLKNITGSKVICFRLEKHFNGFSFLEFSLRNSKQQNVKLVFRLK